MSIRFCDRRHRRYGSGRHRLMIRHALSKLLNQIGGLELDRCGCRSPRKGERKSEQEKDVKIHV